MGIFLSQAIGGDTTSSRPCPATIIYIVACLSTCCSKTGLTGQPSDDSSTEAEDTFMDPAPDPEVEDVREDPVEEPPCPPDCSWWAGVGLRDFEGPTDSLNLDLDCVLTEVEWLIPFPLLNYYHVQCEADEGTLEFVVAITFDNVLYLVGRELLVEGDRVHLRYITEVDPVHPGRPEDSWMTMRNPDGSLAIAATYASRLYPTSASDDWYDPLNVSAGDEDCRGQDRECYVEYRRSLVFTCTDPSCGAHEIWDCEDGSFSSSGHAYWIEVGPAEERRENTCPERHDSWYGFVIASD
jgi:hypothetical protein